MSESPLGPPQTTLPEVPVVARRYLLARELGVGSFGRVWQARDLLSQRDVALKRIRSVHAGDALVRRRLWREARAVARLQHPAVVRLFDYGEDENRDPYVVMELVDGEPISVAAARCTSATILAGWLDQLLDALAFAHARGVIHRDLKPQNVLVTRAPPLVTGAFDRSAIEAAAAAAAGGTLPAEATETAGADSADFDRRRRVKVLDFGLARVEEDPDMNITGSAGEAVGTPVYMAPEQATAHALVGPPSDLYAFGILAWEIFCGQPPFQGSNATATVLLHVRATLPPFQPRPELRVPPELGPLLARTLEKDPRRRPQDAATLRRALRAVFESDDEESEETLVTAATGSLVADLGAPGGGGEPISGLRPALLRPSESPLQGREAWQRHLWARALDMGTRGRPHIVVLDGAPGVGKHRLGRWLYETTAQSGHLLALDLATTAGEVRASDPLGEALRGALGLGPVAPPRPAEAVAQALGHLGEAHLHGAADAEALAERFWGPPGSERPRRAYVLHHLLAALCRARPILLWLGRWEELTPVARYGLCEALRRALEAGLPILAVLSLDGGQEPDPLLPLLRLLNAWPSHVERLTIGGLGPSAIWAALARHLPDEPGQLPYQAELQRAAAGSPFAATQLVHLLWEAGAVRSAGADARWSPPLPTPPAGPYAILRARLAELFARDPDLLGEDVRRLAEALALLGTTFSLSLAERLATRIGHSGRAAAALVERLVDAGLLTEHGKDGLSVAHPIVRDVLLETLDEGTRLRLHHLCAELLLATPGVGLHALTRHLAGSGQGIRAAELRVAAAEDALRVGDLDSADALLGPLAPALSGELEGHAGEAVRHRWTAARARVALEHGRLTEARRLVESLPRPRSGALHGAHMRLEAELLLAEGDAVTAELRLSACLVSAEAVSDAAAAARTRWLLGRAQLARGRHRDARVALIAARGELAAHGEAFSEVRCRLDLSHMAELGGDLAAALRFAQDAVALTGDAAEGVATAEAAARAAELLRRLGQLPEAREAYALAFDRFEARGQTAGVARASKGLAQVERLLGDHAASQRAYERALQAFTAQGDRLQAGQCDMHLGWIHVRQGELDRAESCFLRALHAIAGTEDAVRTGLLHGFLARLAHYRGDRELRQRRLSEALRIDAVRALAVPEWPRMLEELADVHLREGDPDGAAPLLARAADVWRVLRAAEDEQRCRRGLRELSGS